jgi:hypothetical protein
MFALKMFFLAGKLFAVLAMQDFPADAGDAWVCRRNVHAPAGFTFEYVQQVMAGDIQVQYEDDCPLALDITADERV